MMSFESLITSLDSRIICKAAGTVVKITSSLKPNPISKFKQVKLAQILDTHGRFLGKTNVAEFTTLHE